LKTRKYIFQIGLAIAILLVIQQSCSTTKRLPEGAYLLNANKINYRRVQKDRRAPKAQGGSKENSDSESQTNAHLDFCPSKLWLYSAANKPKENKFNWWIKNKVGEAPVILGYDLSY
jgi:outer membrane protein insertion porin family